ncbi:esterase-like activity of phytase family protein [Gordonia sp. zg691]|uniref:esterase-like activity of phytase family protein n=1 Tax=Gordonia jinghuaiqii TaxID=2758710 RepID=UPI0016626628|nr:esterase-like activity of phytase family protein [Gordonia jinghuaiqii]MBD0860507.1 esterase-like activity of phytase family protein [Gordonia jinghuaiqii]
MRLRLWGATIVGACVLGLSSAVAVQPASATPASGAGVTAFYTDSTTVGNGLPTVNRISGLDRIGNGRYVMISEDVLPARFFTATIGYTSATASFHGTPRINGGGTVLGPWFLPLIPGQAQFEGIRQTNGGYTVLSGGNTPFIRQIGPIGQVTRDVPLPAAWRPSSKSGTTGQRGLTGLAVGPQGQISVLTAGGLRQDGRSSARLLTLGKSNREFVYRTDANKQAADVLAVNATDFLVLERGPGKLANIFWTTTRGAASVTGKKKLSGREKAMTKRRIFSTTGTPRLVTGNMSGLAWGNWHPDDPFAKTRTRTLLVVSDDVGAPNRVHSFEVQIPK